MRAVDLALANPIHEEVPGVRLLLSLNAQVREKFRSAACSAATGCAHSASQADLFISSCSSSGCCAG